MNIRFDAELEPVSIADLLPEGICLLTITSNYLCPGDLVAMYQGASPTIKTVEDDKRVDFEVDVRESLVAGVYRHKKLIHSEAIRLSKYHKKVVISLSFK